MAAHLCKIQQNQQYLPSENIDNNQADMNDNIFFMLAMKVISFHGFTYIIVVIFKAGSMFIPSYLLEPAGPFNWYLGSPFTTYTLPPTHSNGGSFQPQ